MTQQRIRSALVTGGGSGLGAAMADALGAAGWHVHVTGRRANPLIETVRRVERSGGRAWSWPADVRDPLAVSAVVDQVVGVDGRLDVLVNNAGVYRSGTPTGVTITDWALSIDTNLTGAMYCAQASARQMLDQQPVDGCRGHLVNVNSGAGLRAYAAGAAYTAAKFGLMGLSEALREELSPQLVKVTDLVVATAVESELSRREGVQRLPADVVGRLLLQVLDMTGPAHVTRVDLDQLLG